MRDLVARGGHPLRPRRRPGPASRAPARARRAPVAQLLHAVHERRVGLVDLLEVGGPGQQVAEAVGLEQHGREVGRVALVDRDQPPGEHALHAAEALLGPARRSCATVTRASSAPRARDAARERRLELGLAPAGGGRAALGGGQLGGPHLERRRRACAPAACLVDRAWRRRRCRRRAASARSASRRAERTRTHGSHRATALETGRGAPRAVCPADKLTAPSVACGVSCRARAEGVALHVVSCDSPRAAGGRRLGPPLPSPWRQGIRRRGTLAMSCNRKPFGSAWAIPVQSR